MYRPIWIVKCGARENLERRTETQERASPAGKPPEANQLSDEEFTTANQRV